MSEPESEPESDTDSDGPPPLSPRVYTNGLLVGVKWHFRVCCCGRVGERQQLGTFDVMWKAIQGNPWRVVFSGRSFRLESELNSLD